MALVPFRKPALALDDQLALLAGRGLQVPDSDRAKRYLQNISYYRFSGYTRYFASPEDPKHQTFRPNVAFDDVVKLYVFDRHMRVLLNEAFERIEVAVKAALAYHGSTLAGPFWMTEDANFDQRSSDKRFNLISESCFPVQGKHKQVFLEAYYNKYSDQYPPAWMITEVLSFHGASMFYKFAKGRIRVPIAAQFGLQQDILESWLHAIVFARNVCAHHARFWNRRFTISPKIPRQYQGIWPSGSANRLYVICSIVHHLLQQIAGDTTWHHRLRDQVNRHPDVPLSAMGFPNDWETQKFWGF